MTNEESGVIFHNSSLVTRHSSLVTPLGWHSETLTRHLRAAAARHQRHQTASDRGWLGTLTNDDLRYKYEEPLSPAPLLPCPPSKITNDESRITNESQAPNSSLVTRHSSLIKVYPDLALGLLRTKTAASGRVWLLLRHGDAAGRGRLALYDVTRLLTGDGSPLRICGRRQLANLLLDGDGLFWDRDTDRHGRQWLRLRSAVRVAASLGVARLGGSPVGVPLSALTGTIGQARAHLYATFHSGRTRTDLLTGEKKARGPISRSTLCKLSGAVANSQRNYERRAAVGRRAAIALGPRLGSTDEHEIAFARGRAMFHLRDARGRHGRPGAVYLAWQLPNEYTGPHATLPRGRLKRLNRSLADLFHDGMTGNGGETGLQVAGGKGQVDSGQGSEVSGRTSSANASPRVTPNRRFYNSARTAFQARHEGERYWRCGGLWLWNGELRVTDDELRMTNDELRVKSVPDRVDPGGPQPSAFLPPATCRHSPSSNTLNSSLVVRHSSLEEIVCTHDRDKVMIKRYEPPHP